MLRCDSRLDSGVCYTVLCADRVGQMTKTYNDIDAITRLLEEVRFEMVSADTGLWHLFVQLVVY